MSVASNKQIATANGALPGLARPDPDLRYDFFLALAALAAAALCAAMLQAPSFDTRVTVSNDSPAIASLQFAVSEVRRRPAGSLVWFELDAGDPVFELDSIFVPPRASASFSMKDGSRLEVEENSLVVLERPGQDGVQVALKKGSLSGSSGHQPLSIQSTGAVTKVARGGQVRVKVKNERVSEVQSLGGDVQVSTPAGRTSLPANTVSLVGGQGLALAPQPFAVLLQEPPRDTRRYYQGALPIMALRWERPSAQGLTIEVAQDTDFQSVLKTFPAEAGEGSLALPAGRYWWRAVDAAGAPQSEARALTVVEDVPPLLASPRDREPFADRPIQFTWSEVPGVTSYELQIAADPEFRQLVHTETVEGTQLRWSKQVPEGLYHWRVRAQVVERGDSPFSQAATFQRLDKPLPAAPKLLGAEPENDHGSQANP